VTVHFKISVTPDRDDPHNWTWTVRWTCEGVAQSVWGPVPGNDVIATAHAARQAAERYADVLAENMHQASTYYYTPKAVVRA
jgi:hypothetical protein